MSAGEALAHVRIYAVEDGGPRSLAAPPGATSVHDALDDIELGVYSALRTFEHTRFLRLRGHIERTERSMAMLGWDYELDRRALCTALHGVCAAYPLEDSRVRFDVAAAPAAVLGTGSRLLITLSPYEPVPERFLEEGVAVATTSDLDREVPLVKTSDFIVRRRPYPIGSQECFEHLMLDPDGRILEGTSSNFFGIRDGTLLTAGGGVLEGITRRIILDLAASIGLSVSLQAVPVGELATLDEAFLSSSSRGIVPIVRIADVDVGDGHPGAATRRILSAYIELARREARTALEVLAGRD